MENDRRTDAISGKQIAFLALVGIAGICAIRWLVRHPDDSRRIDMAILLGTQKVALSCSDGLRALATGCRKVADHAGTQYNEIKSL